jgi:hypothetical protein
MSCWGSPARTSITTNARMHHAVTSSTAAQAITVLPRRVCVRRRSARMRASTGKAVMLIAVPRKRAKSRKATPGSDTRGKR